MIIKELELKIKEKEDAFIYRKAIYNNKKTEIEKIEVKIKELLEKIQLVVDSINFVEEIAHKSRGEVKTKIEALTSLAMKVVYNENYGVLFDYGVSGNKTAVEIFIVKKRSDGKIIKRTIDGHGGGCSDVLSIPLKLMVLLSESSVDKILCLDESGKFLDEVRVEKFGEFLKRISLDFGVQIILVTHWESMVNYADKVFGVLYDGVESKITDGVTNKIY